MPRHHADLQWAEWVRAGGFAEVFTTAHDDALFRSAGSGSEKPSSSTALPGGVGTTAMQLGVVSGAVVTAAVRDPDARSAS